MSIHSDETKDIAAALSKAQAQMEVAQKDATNPHFKSNYATLASIIEAARKPLGECELSFSQILTHNENELCLVTLLMHSSGQWLRSEWPLNGDAGNRGVNRIQALGSEITYIKRYALAAILGISIADEDDDGNNAPLTQKERPAKKPQPQSNGDIPTSPAALLDTINSRVTAPYDNISHLFNAIREESTIDSWSWPKPNDIDGWRNAYDLAKSHADEKTPVAA